MKLEEVKTFLEYIKKKGIVAQNTANSWSAALAGVTSVLDGEEEKTIEFVLESGDIIRNRLQNQSTDVSGATISIYIQRSQLALKNFIEWKKDRAAWERKQAGKVKTEKTDSKAKKEAKQSGARDETIYSSESSSSSTKRILPIPTSNGDTFEVSLPQNYCVDDLVRVMWGLAIYAEDFDPKSVLDRFGKPPTQSQQPRRGDVINAQLTS